jgi:integrase
MQLVSEGMTPATVAHYHRIVRAALNLAEKWEWGQSECGEACDPRSAARPEMHVPTVDQARALVLRAAATISPDLGPILLFAMLSGMRRGELCGVQWGDVDRLGRTVTVRRSVWQVWSTWGVKDPKTHQARTLALDEAGIALLLARKTRAEHVAKAAGVKLRDDAFMWSTMVDGHAPRSPNSLTRAFHRLCRTMEQEAAEADPEGSKRGILDSMIFGTFRLPR